MRKFLVFICCFLSFTCAVFCSCKQVNPLYDRVSELRCDVFEGNGKDFSLVACYGFKETPYLNDAAVCERVNLLTFKLIGKETTNATYSISFEQGSEKYSAAFKLNPITHSVTASVEIDNFTEKSFTVSVLCGSNSESVNLVSTLPENTIDYKTALDNLYQKQKDLIDRYTDEQGNINAEIYARVIVKDQKPYWYIGIASGNDDLKALLIDGLSGEILAIREVF